VGSAVSLDAVLDFTDMMLLFMTFPNILGMIIPYPEVSKELREYLADLKSGVIKRYK
jgi:AGCS family alanine or glycine:cation symporter